MQGKLVPWEVVLPWWRSRYLRREGKKAVTPKPSDRLVRQVLEAIQRAGAEGQTDLELDRLFGWQLAGAQRTYVFYILEGRGQIVGERSPGGGMLWKSVKHCPQVKRPAGDGPKVYRFGRWEPDLPLRSYTCRLWPSLEVGGQVKFSNGRFVTGDPDLQKLVEHAYGFGVHIFQDPDGSASEAELEMSRSPLQPERVKKR